MADADDCSSSLRTLENREATRTGIVLAIYCSGKSDTLDGEKPVQSSHGGARLRADRTSSQLTRKQARAILLAALAADQIGEPFTRMVTVHWDRAGIPDHGAAVSTGKLTKLMCDWARRRHARILWAWVRECDKSKGSHVHMLIACPPRLQIGRMWRRWLRLITRRPYRKGVINTRRIGGTLAASLIDPATYRQQLFNTAAYVCKGIAPESVPLLGLRRTEPGGTVIGKRSAVCQILLGNSRNRNRLNS